MTRIDPRTTGISDAEADAWLGDLLAHMNRQEEATARLEKALAAKPDLALAHVSLGTLQMRQGKTADGMAHLKEAQALGTANERAHFAYASSLVPQAPRDTDALRQARSALERAIAIRPNHTEAKLLLGYVYLVSGEAVAARDLLTPLVQTEPANHRAALRLGEALLSLSDLDGARAVVGPVLSRATSEEEREQARRLLAAVGAQRTRRSTLASAGSPTADSAPTSDSVATSTSGPTANPTTSAGRGTTYHIPSRWQWAATSLRRVRIRGMRVGRRDTRCAHFGRRAPHAGGDSQRNRLHRVSHADDNVGSVWRAKPMDVYLTWQPAGRSGGTEGTVVAVRSCRRVRAFALINSSWTS